MTLLRSVALATFLVCIGHTFSPRAHAAGPTQAKSQPTVLTIDDFARVAEDTDALLADRSPLPVTKNLFKTYDNADHVYKRNPDGIAAGLNFTCVSVANSANAFGTGGNRGCVTLITALQGVTNTHFTQSYDNGVVHYFVDRANAVHARKIVGSQNIAGTDLQLVTFDSPLPASVVPAPLLPAGAAARLLPRGTPLLATNQEKRVVVTELAGFAGGEIVVRPAIAPGRRAWTASPPAVVGDSDSPTFVLIDHRLWLLCTYHTNITGPSISENLAALRRFLSPDYPLDVATVR